MSLLPQFTEFKLISNLFMSYSGGDSWDVSKNPRNSITRERPPQVLSLRSSLLESDELSEAPEELSLTLMQVFLDDENLSSSQENAEASGKKNHKKVGVTEAELMNSLTPEPQSPRSSNGLKKKLVYTPVRRRSKLLADLSMAQYMPVSGLPPSGPPPTGISLLEAFEVYQRPLESLPSNASKSTIAFWAVLALQAELEMSQIVLKQLSDTLNSHPNWF